MPRPKGLAKTGGRQKGTKNKAPELRAMIAEALDVVGGVDYLAKQAQENPGPFLQLLGRLIPKEINAEISGELTVRQEVRRDLIDRLVLLVARPGSLQQAQQALIDHAMDTAAGLPAIAAPRPLESLTDGEQERAPLTRADAAAQPS